MSLDDNSAAIPSAINQLLINNSWNRLVSSQLSRRQLKVKAESLAIFLLLGKTLEAAARKDTEKWQIDVFWGCLWFLEQQILEINLKGI